MESSKELCACSREEVLALHCNFSLRNGRPCAQRVEVGWLTNCSHLLCTEHAKEWCASNVDCPVCRAGAIRMVKVDFRMARRERNLKMVGFLPHQVLQAASEAFEFWVQQKMLEHDWQAEAGTRILAREARLRDAYHECAAKAKRAVERLSEKKRELTQRLRDASERGCQLQAEAEEARRKLERVERRCAALQAADDGWRKAPAWRRRGDASQEVARDTSGTPGPSAFAGVGLSAFGARLGALGASSAALGGGGAALRRGAATPAGFAGLAGLSKRRRIT